MSEQQGDGADVPPGESSADPSAWVPGVGEVPEPPEWLAEFWACGRSDEEWVRDFEVGYSGVTAPDRFEEEFGLPWVPAPVASPGVPGPVVSEEVAARLQAAAVQVASVQAIAEAHRVAAILSAYEAAMADLQVRFDSRIGSRAGLGAQAFFTSMALQVKAHPRRIAHEVDTALILRDRMPLTWDVFQHGHTTWARAALAASTAEGLDRAHWAEYDEAAARLVARGRSG